MDGKEKTEVERLIDDALDNAKYNYDYRQCVNKYEGILQWLDNLDNQEPIKNKAEAITAVSLILEFGVDNKTAVFAPILHKLGMRLVDYLLRCDP